MEIASIMNLITSRRIAHTNFLSIKALISRKRARRNHDQPASRTGSRFRSVYPAYFPRTFFPVFTTRRFVPDVT